MSRTLAQCGTRAARRRHQIRDETCPTCTPKPTQLKPCGTPAAWRRHKRHGEQPCQPCIQAIHAHDNARRPKSTNRTHKPQTLAATALIEELTFLINAGEGYDRILQATGYQGRPKSLQSRLYRANRHDLAHHIKNLGTRRMNATVKPNPYGGRGWVGYCQEHSATIAGPMASVDLWADIHNEEHHEEETV